jgi:hypothetical protein
VIKLNEESNPEKTKESPLKKLLKDKKPKKPEFVVAVIVNIIMFYVVNNLVSWNISFIDASFNNILWIFNISIAANILANVAFLVYYSDWFRSIIQIILNIIGFVVVYYLYVVYPFIFSDAWVNYALIVVLVLAMVVIVIATFVEALRFILKHIIKFEA